jgi:RNA polymerase sigma-70 factor (ECF subfamily)
MATERAVDAAWSAGRSAWPSLAVARDAFAEHVAGVLGEIADDDLAQRDAAGLYLAAAVVTGDPAAPAAVASLVPAVDPVLRQLGADRARIDDIRQHVLSVVVVGGERGPAIAGYAGRSDVRSWLRSVAVRSALKQWSRDKPALDLDDDLVGLADDPELAHLKSLYAEHVVAAIRDAIAALPSRARTLLRLHHLDGLTVDDLGRMYQVHRATAARWLAAARETVFEDTRVRLEAKLGLGEDSVVSIVRLVHSQLMLSMRRLLDS